MAGEASGTPRSPTLVRTKELDNFVERRDVTENDEEALEPLDGSTYSPVRTEIYRGWRSSDAPIKVSLIRASEVTREDRDDDKDAR